MIGAVARRLFGSSNERRIRTYRPRVDAINALEKDLERLSDDAVRARIATALVSLKELVEEAFRGGPLADSSK